tara:strand:- start:2022 stop:2561 length:540 start_codon:yes stop_codon:yes gene_type:complete
MTYKNKQLIEQYKILHNQNPGYGNGYNNSTLDLDHLNIFLKSNSSKLILDYGCGKGDLTKYLNKSYTCYGYDPAIDEYNNEHKNKNFDTIICLDVLEHIPEGKINALLDHIKTYNVKSLYFIVSTRYAKTLLPDGRNCHETVKPKEWWQDIFKNAFINKNVIITEQKKLNQIRISINEN